MAWRSRHGTLTVAQVVNDWLAYGLSGRTKGTVDKWKFLCRAHVILALGSRKLRELSATDVDRWLADKAKVLSTRTLQDLHQCLNRAVNRALARDQVKRNMVSLCSVPKGTAGRPWKSLTLDQARAVLDAVSEPSGWALTCGLPDAGANVFAYSLGAVSRGQRWALRARSGVPPSRALACGTGRRT